MKDLGSVNHEDFQACLGQTFTAMPGDGDALELELIQVKSNGAFDPKVDARQSFSALFRGPLEPSLPQRLYGIDNATFNEQFLFLVPVGPDERGMLYDATFN